MASRRGPVRRQVLVSSRDRIDPDTTSTAAFRVDLGPVVPDGLALTEASLGDIDMPAAVDTIGAKENRLYADEGFPILDAKRTLTLTAEGADPTPLVLPLTDNPVTAAHNSSGGAVTAGYTLRLTLKHDAGEPLGDFVDAWVAQGLAVRLRGAYGHVDGSTGETDITISSSSQLKWISAKVVDVVASSLTLRWNGTTVNSVAIDNSDVYNPKKDSEHECRPYAVLHFERPRTAAQLSALVAAALPKVPTSAGVSAPLTATSLAYDAEHDEVVVHSGASTLKIEGTAAHFLTPAASGATLTQTGTAVGPTEYQYVWKPAVRPETYAALPAGAFSTGAALASAAQRALRCYWGTEDSASQALVLSVSASSGGPTIDIALDAGAYTASEFASEIQAKFAEDTSVGDELRMADLGITVTADASQAFTFTATAPSTSPATQWTLRFDAPTCTVDAARLGFRRRTYRGASTYVADETAGVAVPLLNASMVPRDEVGVSWDAEAHRLEFTSDPAPAVSSTGIASQVTLNQPRMFARIKLTGRYAFRDWDRVTVTYSETHESGTYGPVDVRVVEGFVMPAATLDTDGMTAYTQPRTVVNLALAGSEVGGTGAIDTSGTYGGIDITKVIKVASVVPTTINLYGNVAGRLSDSLPHDTLGLVRGVSSFGTPVRMLQTSKAPRLIRDDDFALLCLGFGPGYGTSGDDAPWVGPMTYKKPGERNTQTREVFARVLRRDASSSYVNMNPMAFVWPGSVGVAPLGLVRVEVLDPDLKRVDFAGRDVTFVLNCTFVPVDDGDGGCF